MKSSLFSAAFSRAGVLGLALGTSLAGTASAFGPDGHKVVAEVARIELRNTPAGAHVTQLLGNVSLPTASLWADRIKGGPLANDGGESRAFLNAHQDHKEWHYVNLPFQARFYRESTPGARSNDVVHKAEECIRILQSNTTQNGITPRVALMLLIHYVGDIHQPLHVGCGYVDSSSRQFVNPAWNQQAQDDAGGNALQFVDDREGSVHGFMDSDAVNIAMRRGGTTNALRYAQSLHQRHQSGAFRLNASAEDMIREMVNDVMPDAEVLYDKLSLTQWDASQKKWKVAPAPDFQTKAADIVTVNLAKGGYRLAALLKAIWPQ